MCRNRSASSRIDGMPIRFQGSPSPAVQWVNHIGVPPGARVEFIVEGPPPGVPALLVTRSVDTGPAGENDPNRELVAITSPRPMRPIRKPHCPRTRNLCRRRSRPWLGNVAPVRVRKLFFSEQPENPNDPNSPTKFFLRADGETPKPFDPQSDAPDIVVRQGDVEDWIIENRSMELHDFHIHQLHFQLLEWSGLAVNEPFLRDTVNVPYYNGRMLSYPSVRLRMDFRDPNIVGTFVYHCHLLEHEDGGHDGTNPASLPAEPPQRPPSYVIPTHQRRAYDARQAYNHVGCRVAALVSAPLALGQLLVSPVLAAEGPVPTHETGSPIKHVIVIIGENRSFDHVFATYVPKRPEENVFNLLSQGIIKLDANNNALPGPNFEKAHQLAAKDVGTTDAFLLSPPKQTFPNDQLPAPLVGGPRSPTSPTSAAARRSPAARRAWRWPSSRKTDWIRTTISTS